MAMCVRVMLAPMEIVVVYVAAAAAAYNAFVFGTK